KPKNKKGVPPVIRQGRLCPVPQFIREALAVVVEGRARCLFSGDKAGVVPTGQTADAGAFQERWVRWSCTAIVRVARMGARSLGGVREAVFGSGKAGRYTKVYRPQA